MFNKLVKRGDDFFISERRDFVSIYEFPDVEIEKVFDFAFGMTFDDSGEHRNHRSGGKHVRKNGEVFVNTFQGKLSEFGMWNFLRSIEIDSPEPDLTQWKLGKWDAFDLSANNKKINVKSTKSFGNLLLLETKDWNTNGEYIPNIGKNNSKYDFFVLTRIKPNAEYVMTSQRMMYSNELPKELDLKKIFLEQGPWKFDFAGFITHEELVHIINSNFVLPQNSYLNGKTPMDAENYYVQAGDMRNPEEFSNFVLN